MAPSKRIMVSLPNTLLQEVDGIAALEKKNRSQCIREAMRLYLEEKRRHDLRERLRRGYAEMASFNLLLAEQDIHLDPDSGGPWDQENRT